MFLTSLSYHVFLMLKYGVRTLPGYWFTELSLLYFIFQSVQMVVVGFSFFYIKAHHLSVFRVLTVYFYFLWTPAVTCDLLLATISPAKRHSEKVLVL